MDMHTVEDQDNRAPEKLTFMQRRRRRGISLMEGILGGILLAIGAYEVFQNWGGANMQANISTDQNQVSYLVGNIKEYYKAYNTYAPQAVATNGAAAVALNTQNAVRMHWFQPNSVTDNSGATHPSNPWGGQYDVAASGNGLYFAVAQNHVPAQACAVLTAIVNDSGGGGVVGTTIATDSSAAGNTPTATAPTTPSYADTATCASTSTANSYYTISLVYGR